MVLLCMVYQIIYYREILNSIVSSIKYYCINKCGVSILFILPMSEDILRYQIHKLYLLAGQYLCKQNILMGKRQIDKLTPKIKTKSQHLNVYLKQYLVSNKF